MKLKINSLLFRYPLQAVFLFTLVCLLPLMILRDFTPSNELRYLSIADEAITGGNVFAFYNHGIAYADKPPLYIWITMLCRMLFGHHSCLALSLFSLIPAFVTTNILDRWVMKGASAADRIAIAMMLLTSIMFLGTSAVVRMDMLMCMFTVLALYTFWQMYSDNCEGITSACQNRRSWLLPMWIFLALFTKGPVGLLVPPISIVVFLTVKGKWREISKYLGWKTWGVIAVLCLIWFTGAYIDGGREYIENLLFRQTLGRAVNAFTHSRPFWFYAIAILWCTAPYTILAIGALIESTWPDKRHGASASETRKISTHTSRPDIETFFLCIIFSTFVMLSSFSSKLPIYLVPILPFLIYLFPMVLNRFGCRRWMLWATGIPACLFMAVGLCILSVLCGVVKPEMTEKLGDLYAFAFSGPVKVASVILIAGNMLALWFLLRRCCWNLPVFMIGSTLLLTIYAASGITPKLNPHIGYKAVCEAVQPESKVVTLFVSRPENMDVYLNKQITEDFGKNVEDFMKKVPGLAGPVTVIVKTTGLEKHPELRSFVLSSRNVVYVGPYCVANL